MKAFFVIFYSISAMTLYAAGELSPTSVTNTAKGRNKPSAATDTAVSNDDNRAYETMNAKRKTKHYDDSALMDLKGNQKEERGATASPTIPTSP